MTAFFRAANLDDGREALRRYAGAFAGSVAVADDLLAASETDEPVRNSRAARYRRLHQMLAVQKIASTGGSALGRLPPLERAALLLTSLEGFSYATVADILDLDHAAVRSLLQAARQRLNPADQGPIRVAVLADASGDVRDVVETVCSLGHRICGIVADMAGMRDLVRRESPDLVLAEVTGLTLMQDLQREIRVPVVFLSNQAVRMIQRDGAPALVLAKPVLPSALAAILAVVLQRRTTARPSEYRPLLAASGASARLPCSMSADRGTTSFPSPAPLPATFRGSRATAS